MVKDAPTGPVVRVFNGRYTVESTKTGEHRTFEIRTQPAKATFAPGQRIVAILSGPQNTQDYTDFAFIDEVGIHVWKRMPEIYKAYANVLWSLAVDGAFSPWVERGYRLLMEGACVKCNRPLTTPESIRNGIGPICAEGY